MTGTSEKQALLRARDALRTAESEMRDLHFDHPARKEIDAAIDACNAELPEGTSAYDSMLEVLEMVALAPATCGVYVLDKQDMKQVRAAIDKARGFTGLIPIPR